MLPYITDAGDAHVYYAVTSIQDRLICFPWPPCLLYGGGYQASDLSCTFRGEEFDAQVNR
jgi:hypothetical protein